MKPGTFPKVTAYEQLSTWHLQQASDCVWPTQNFWLSAKAITHVLSASIAHKVSQGADKVESRRMVKSTQIARIDGKELGALPTTSTDYIEGLMLAASVDDEQVR